MTNSLRTRTHALIASFVFGLLLWVAPAAIAKYRPPKTPSTPKGTGTNTTRGGSCDSSGNPRSERRPEVGLTPLAPLSHIGQTTSQHPTFVWFVPDRQSYPLQFRLFTATGQRLHTTEMQSQPGIMQVSLPQTQPGLATGQSYVWQVVLVCNPKAPSMSVVATAEIAVIKPSAALQTQLTTTQTPQQRINLYAESGLWYDALAEARTNPQNQVAISDLLNSLASSEAQTWKEWSDQLKQIEATLTLSAKQRKQQ
ncbi:DUF928 domain-containing protein [Phormidesmis sp. 146-33]